MDASSIPSAVTLTSHSDFNGHYLDQVAETSRSLELGSDHWADHLISAPTYMYTYYKYINLIKKGEVILDRVSSYVNG